GWGRSQLVAVRPGQEPRVLVDVAEESGMPAAIVGDHLAFTIGTEDARRLALASLTNGRIIRRYSASADRGTNLSASPDGKTIYYSSAGVAFALPIEGGEPRRVTEGTDVVVDPSGRYLDGKRSRNG